MAVWYSSTGAVRGGVSYYMDEPVQIRYRRTPGLHIWEDVATGKIIRQEHVTNRQRHKERHKKFWKAMAGPLGVAVGFFSPFLLPFKWSLVTGSAIGIGGYLSPHDSFLRTFSIGAGVGGLLHAGYRAYRWWNKPGIFERMNATLAPDVKGNWFQKLGYMNEQLIPGTDAWARTAQIKAEADAAGLARFGGSRWNVVKWWLGKYEPLPVPE